MALEVQKFMSFLLPIPQTSPVPPNCLCQIDFVTRDSSLFITISIRFASTESLSAHSKASLLTPGCGEGQCGVYCRAPSEESSQLVLKNSQMAFRKRFFKGRVKDRVIGVCGQLVIHGW